MPFFRTTPSEILQKSNNNLSVESLEDRLMLSTVEIFAAGSTGQENFNLLVNGAAVQTFSNVGGDVESRNFVRFTFETQQQLSPGDIGIEFFNDAFDPSIGLDRNLLVDRIVVDGVTVQTEDASTFSTGIWDNGLTGPGFFQTEFFNINATFNYADPAGASGGDGDRIEFSALGTTGDEIVELVIDGQVVDSFGFNNAGVTQNFSFESSDSNVSIEDVRIQFVNDFFDANQGIDRNAQIFEYRVIDGATGNTTVANTNDSNVLSDGIFVAGEGITSGFGAGGFLAGNGFVEIQSGGSGAGLADALEILGVADGNFNGVVQGESVDSVNNGGDFGAVTLTVIDGSNDVQASNFGSNSFQLSNTGNKEVAAVFIDIREAVFGDMVFDINGTGGDTVAKTFRVDDSGNTGAFFVGSNNASDNAANLFLAGEVPLADTSGFGDAISGGNRGLLIRFTGFSGGFDGGETVGFSGDGDPNSLAGFSQNEVGFGNGANGNAITGTFDSGGQSGAELIGSSFTVLFADGTTATGFLGSDVTQAGSAGEAVQGREQRTPVVTVDTGSGVFSSDGNSNGQYGGSVPQISVSGQPGDVVRVNLFKGFNPVTTSAGSPDSVAEVIQGRLDASLPEFPVNNAFDVQTYDVFIGASGQATLSADAFDYNDAVSGISFDGDDVQALAITAAIVVPATDGSVIAGGAMQSLVPLGAVSTPIYLLNPTQTPVS